MHGQPILTKNKTVAYYGTLMVSNNVTNGHSVYIMAINDYHIHGPWYLHYFKTKSLVIKAEGGKMGQSASLSSSWTQTIMGY